MPEVQIISAPWCKRCQVVKPDVTEHCRIGGAELTILDYDEMEDEDKASVKSLPTIRIRVTPDAGWMIFTADSLEQFKQTLVKAALSSTTTDF